MGRGCCGHTWSASILLLAVWEHVRPCPNCVYSPAVSSTILCPPLPRHSPYHIIPSNTLLATTTVLGNPLCPRYMLVGQQEKQQDLWQRGVSIHFLPMLSAFPRARASWRWKDLFSPLVGFHSSGLTDAGCSPKLSSLNLVVGIWSKSSLKDPALG